MATVKFGDVVREVKVNIDRSKDNHEFYIAGEHMESDNIHLTKRGCFAGSDVGPAFIRLFKPGQILYGSRRTYLKKVAVADFEGITSNTTFVLESKDEDKMLQGLIPFLMLSESFTDYAVKHSKGSTNPYILFSDLAEYEFNLPDIEKQKSLLRLLTACDEAKERYKALIQCTDDLVKSQFIEMFYGKGYPEHKLKELCSKITDGTHKTPNYQDSGITFISAKNIIDGKLSFDDVKYITTEEYKEIQKRCMTEPGDVLMAKSGSLGTVAIIDTDQPLGLFESLAVLKYNRAKLNGIFLKEQLRSDTAQRQLMAGVKGVAVKHLHLNVISEVPVIVPPIDIQRQFAAFVEQSDKSKFVLRMYANRAVRDLRCSFASPC